MPAFGDIFGSDTHMYIGECFCQTVFYHRVYYLSVAHTMSVAGVRQQVGSVCHTFGAAAEYDVGVACFDDLCGERYATKPRAADYIYWESGLFDRYTRVYCHLTYYILSQTCTEHIARYYFVYLVGADACTSDCLFGCYHAYLHCRHTGKRTVETADRRTGGRYYHYFFTHTFICSFFDN